MSIKSLNNPFDGDVSLNHVKGCECASCSQGYDEKSYGKQLERQADSMTEQKSVSASKDTPSTEDIMDRAIESAIVRGMFGHNDLKRRQFIKTVGATSFAAALGSVLPMDKVKAAVKDSMGPLEKRN